MSQPTCEPIVEAIRKLTQDLYAIDDQLHALEVEGMNQQHPWAYVVLQRQADRPNPIRGSPGAVGAGTPVERLHASTGRRIPHLKGYAGFFFSLNGKLRL